MQARTVRAICLSMLAILLLCQAANPQSIISGVPGLAAGDPFALGTTLAKPNTLNFQRLDDLIQRTAGRVSPQAYMKYGGDFEKYWTVSKAQRSGKAFEAIAAFNENRRLMQLGEAERYVVTAAEEGGRSHAADILRLNAKSEVVEQFQFKLGWKAAHNALQEPKYAGITIKTPRDQFELAARRLAKAEARAAGRGLPSSGKWATLKEAIGQERYLPAAETRALIGQQAERQARMEWELLQVAEESKGARGLNVFGRASRGFRVIGSAAGKAFVVVDVATVGYQTYCDVERYRAGEIGGGYLAAKCYMRSAQLTLTYYAIASPEPLTKFVAAIGAVVLVVGDEVSESVYQARLAQARRLLEGIDRDERFYAARQQLLRELEPARGKSREVGPTTTVHTKN